MNRIFTIGMILASLTIFSGFTCNPPAILDTGFDLWCGEHLCAWEEEEGHVERVSTWHRSDYGVELVGNPASISQLALQKISCVEFRLQIDRDADASVYIEMDFQNDGSYEYSHPIATDRFEPAHYFITPPSWYQSVKFRVRKVGFGRVVLARVEVYDGDGCTGAPVADIGDRPDGAACEKDLQCESGSCTDMILWRPDVDGSEVESCSGCESHSDCLAGEACGLEYGELLYLYQDCGPEARHGLGERCVFDEECSTSVCCEGVCAECCSSQDCPAGECKPIDWLTLGEDYEFQILPRQCSPGEGLGQAGAACMRAADCQSGQCAGDGNLRACFLDGRRCARDEDCPLWPACLTIGIAGGECQ